MSPRRRTSGRPAILPLRAVYSVGELAKATALDRRRLLRLLVKAGVEVLHVSRLRLVPLSELEKKARPLWESIESAEMLRHGTEIDEGELGDGS